MIVSLRQNFDFKPQQKNINLKSTKFQSDIPVNLKKKRHYNPKGSKSNSH